MVGPWVCFPGILMASLASGWREWVSHKPSMQHPRAGPELTSEDREDPVSCELWPGSGPSSTPHTCSRRLGGKWGVSAGPQTVTAVGPLGECGGVPDTREQRQTRNGCWSWGDTRTPR